MHILRLSLVPLLILSLGACGFHLRGKESSIQTIHAVTLTVDSDVSVSIRQDIERQLQQFKVQVTDDAEYELFVDSSEFSQRRVASSRTSFTDRYIMNYSISAQMRKGSQHWPLHVFSERVFQENLNFPTGKTREATLIRNELTQVVIADLANQVRSFQPANDEPAVTPANTGATAAPQ